MVQLSAEVVVVVSSQAVINKLARAVRVEVFGHVVALG